MRPLSDRIRVVVDGGSLARPPTGISRWVRGLYGALSELPDLDPSLATGLRYFVRGGRSHRVPNLLRERWWYERTVPRLAQAAKADVLLMPSNLSARRGRIPQVVCIMDVNFLSEPGTYERTFVRYASWAYRRAIRDAARLVAISSWSRDEICRHLDADPARFDVIYPGLDAIGGASEVPAPHPRPYALYVGATELHKNVDLLLDIWRDRSPGGLDLAIVGRPGRAHGDVLARAERSGGRITVRGGVGQAELERWYRSASIFLFPSRTEGFGYPPLEAMLRGVPVVASRAGALPEVLGTSAVLLDPADPAAWVEAIERLVEDASERETLIHRGLNRARGYRWTGAAEEMAVLLRDAAASPRLSS